MTLQNHNVQNMLIAAVALAALLSAAYIASAPASHVIEFAMPIDVANR